MSGYNARKEWWLWDEAWTCKPDKISTVNQQTKFFGHDEADRFVTKPKHDGISLLIKHKVVDDECYCTDVSPPEGMAKALFPKSKIDFSAVFEPEVVKILEKECENIKGDCYAEIVATKYTGAQPFHAVCGIPNRKRNKVSHAEVIAKNIRVVVFDCDKGVDAVQRDENVVKWFPDCEVDIGKDGEFHWPKDKLVVTFASVVSSKKNVRGDIATFLERFNQEKSPGLEGLVVIKVKKNGKLNGLEKMGEQKKYTSEYTGKIKSQWTTEVLFDGLRKIGKQQICASFTCPGDPGDPGKVHSTLPLYDRQLGRLEADFRHKYKLRGRVFNIGWYINPKRGPGYPDESRWSVYTYHRDGRDDEEFEREKDDRFQILSGKRDDVSHKPAHKPAQIGGKTKKDMSGDVWCPMKKAHLTEYQKRKGQEWNELNQHFMGRLGKDLTDEVELPDESETHAQKQDREEYQRQEQTAAKKKAAEELTFAAQKQAMPFWWRGCMEKSRGDQNNILVDIIEGQVKRTSGPGSKYVDPLMMTQVSLVAKKIGFEWRLYPKLAVFEDTEANRQKALQRITDDTAAKKTQSSNARKLKADKKRSDVLATPEGMKAVQELADKQAKKRERELKVAEDKRKKQKAADEKKQVAEHKRQQVADKKNEPEPFSDAWYEKYL